MSATPAASPRPSRSPPCRSSRSDLVEPRADRGRRSPARRVRAARRRPRPITRSAVRTSSPTRRSPIATPRDERLVEQRSAQAVAIDFLPHSGPFARGIHVTLTCPPARGRIDRFPHRIFSRSTPTPPFVDVLDRAARATGRRRHQPLPRSPSRRRGDSVVVFSVIDNLIKGASGGGVQWMNRLFGFPEDAGLHQPGLGWL